jgi:predicted negative regulator of RcsB-dependent stress response
MSEKKLERKKLKQLDWFQIRAIKMLNYLGSQKSVLIGLIVVIVAIVGLAWGVKYYDAHQADGRRAEFAKIEEMRAKELEAFNAEGDKRDAEITKIDTEIAKLGNNDPAKKTALEGQKKALENAEAVAEPSYKESSQAFKAYFEKYKDTPEGWAAGILHTADLFKAKDYAGAQKMLEEIVANSKESTFYQLQGRLMLVSVYEDTQQYDKAISQTDELLKMELGTLKPRVLLAKGRILALKNQKDEAEKMFNDIIEQHAESPEAQKARGYKALLN